MKKLFLFATAFTFSFAAMAQPKADAKPDDVLKVNTENHSFGKIKQSVPVSYEFELTNKSDKPLVVENTSGSCGCTTPEKITEPIMPGKTVKLKVNFNAAAAGPINKQVFIKLAGFDENKTINISGEVLTAEAYDAYVKTKGNR
jgi:hypothetical protein